MGLHSEITKLKNLKNPEAGILSIFLSTKPDDRDKWKTHLKNGLKEIDQQLQEQGDTKKIQAFEELREKIDNELKHNETSLLRSIVIYAEGGGGLFELHYLQLDVENEFAYSDTASVKQLEHLDQRFPKTGILVAQLDSVTVYSSALGEIEDSVTFELDLETDHWRKYQGRSGKGQAASSSQVDQFDSRKEKQIRRFYREVSTEVSTLHKAHGWSELVLIGHQRTIKLLEDELNLEISHVFHKNLGGATEAEVLRVAFD